jgi:hypothetical protein
MRSRAVGDTPKWFQHPGRIGRRLRRAWDAVRGACVSDASYSSNRWSRLGLSNKLESRLNGQCFAHVQNGPVTPHVGQVEGFDFCSSSLHSAHAA